MDRDGVASWLLIVLLTVLALAGLAEVSASRAIGVSEARRTPVWQVLVQAGDQAWARGDAPAARRAYLRALFQARGEGSEVGMLRAAEGFRALGDREVVEQALRMVSTPGPIDKPEEFRRIQALRDRLDPAPIVPIPTR